MALINPHVNFNGNAEEASTFYKSVFGGEFAKVIRFKDLDCKLVANEKGSQVLKLITLSFSSDRVRIQTLNLLIRSQMLYSVELRSLFSPDSYRRWGCKYKKDFIFFDLHCKKIC